MAPEGLTRYVAICPDCERFKNLEAMPIVVDFWPECMERAQPMNIYERPNASAPQAKETCDAAAEARIRLASTRVTDTQFDYDVERREGWSF